MSVVKDIIGSPVKEGHLVLVKIGNEWVPAKVHKVEPGGVLIPINPTQASKTGDKITVLFELNLADALPGNPHSVLRRVPNPENEVIVPVTKGDLH